MEAITNTYVNENIAKIRAFVDDAVTRNAIACEELNPRLLRNRIAGEGFEEMREEPNEAGEMIGVPPGYFTHQERPGEILAVRGRRAYLVTTHHLEKMEEPKPA